MKLTVDDINTALVHLSQKQRAKIKQAITALDGNEPILRGADNPEELLIYQALSKEVESATGEPFVDYNAFRNIPRFREQYIEFKKRIPAVVKFAEMKCECLNRTQKIKLYRLVAATLVKRIQSFPSNVALTPKTMIRQLGEVAKVFDQQFPGYVKNGLVKSFLIETGRKPA